MTKDDLHTLNVSTAGALGKVDVALKTLAASKGDLETLWRQTQDYVQTAVDKTSKTLTTTQTQSDRAGLLFALALLGLGFILIYEK